MTEDPFCGDENILYVFQMFYPTRRYRLVWEQIQAHPLQTQTRGL